MPSLSEWTSTYCNSIDAHGHICSAGVPLTLLICLIHPSYSSAWSFCIHDSLSAAVDCPT